MRYARQNRSEALRSRRKQRGKAKPFVLGRKAKGMVARPTWRFRARQWKIANYLGFKLVHTIVGSNYKLRSKRKESFRKQIPWRLKTLSLQRKGLLP